MKINNTFEMILYETQALTKKFHLIIETYNAKENYCVLF